MRVAVIIPTYNRANYIGEALDSVFMQDYPDKRIIIVNDGGRDDTEKVIEKYIGKGHWIIYLDKAHTNLADTLNVGIQNSESDLICTLDDDDLMYDSKSLTKRVNCFLNNPGLEFLWTSATEFSNVKESPDRIKTAECLSITDEFARDRIFINSIMWRRSIHERIGYFDDTLTSNEDWDWKLRCLMGCNCMCFPDIISVRHREHPGMMSTAHRQSGELERNERRFKGKIMDAYKEVVCG
jgi:glycosyltransferase involved in cell wall biosynthesis